MPTTFERFWGHRSALRPGRADVTEAMPEFGVGRSGAHVADATERSGAIPAMKLSLAECFLACFVFAAWLMLFAGGILVDTKPYRAEISSGGVAALDTPPPSSTAVTQNPARSPAPSYDPLRLPKAWLIVVLCFLPINLALVCATAGVLGAFGSLANLHDDQARRTSFDTSNPYVSAMLRGFFVYLFMTSGLLLLDDDPFSNPTPGQYIRLAGFLSLFSFVVNYHPYIFSMLLVWAFQRIQVRSGEDGARASAGTETDIRYAKATTVEVAAVHTAPAGADESSQPATHAAHGLSRGADEVGQREASGRETRTE